jgi:signal peptidase I
MDDASNENNELNSSTSDVSTANELNLDNEPTDTKGKKALRITNIVVNTIFYIFIALLLLFSISQIAGSKDNKVKNVFGLGYEVVASDSMSPTFKKNDLIWVKTNFKEKDLKVGTIATFFDMYSTNPTSNSKGFLNTHRIVDIVDLNDDGKVDLYVLQGDYKKGTADDYSTWTDAQKEAAWNNYQYASGPVQIVQSASDFKAIYIGHWDGTGSFINWLSNPKKGFILVIFITAIFLLFEMFMVIKNIMDIRTAKLIANKEVEKEEMKKNLDAEREKMKQELLAQLKAEQEANNNASNESTDVDSEESDGLENTDTEIEEERKDEDSKEE